MYSLFSKRQGEIIFFRHIYNYKLYKMKPDKSEYVLVPL